jgi:hypothetical protein
LTAVLKKLLLPAPLQQVPERGEMMGQKTPDLEVSATWLLNISPHTPKHHTPTLFLGGHPAAIQGTATSITTQILRGGVGTPPYGQPNVEAE